MSSVVAAVDDLFFATRIRETARQAGVPVQVVQVACFMSAESSEPVDTTSLIVDLNSQSAIRLIERVKANANGQNVYILGFASHVATDLINAARAAGCDQVMARSAFSRDLPGLLRKLAGAHEISQS